MALTSLTRSQYLQVQRIRLRMIDSTTVNSVSQRLGCSRAFPYLLSTPNRRMQFVSSPLEKLLPMKQKSSSRKSQTNLRRLRTMKDADVKITAEHPEVNLKHIVGGIVRHGLKSVPPKASVSLRIDADVLKWFKSHGAGYQTRINAVLRAFSEAAR